MCVKDLRYCNEFYSLTNFPHSEGGEGLQRKQSCDFESPLTPFNSKSYNIYYSMNLLFLLTILLNSTIVCFHFVAQSWADSFFCFVIWLLILVCSIQVYLYGAHVTSWKNDHGEELLFVSNKVLLKFLHGFFESVESFSFLWYAAFIAFKFVTLCVMKDIW